MPGEPLVVLHVALTEDISDNIQVRSHAAAGIWKGVIYDDIWFCSRSVIYGFAPAALKNLVDNTSATVTLQCIRINGAEFVVFFSEHCS